MGCRPARAAAAGARRAAGASPTWFQWDPDKFAGAHAQELLALCELDPRQVAAMKGFKLGRSAYSPEGSFPL